MTGRTLFRGVTFVLAAAVVGLAAAQMQRDVTQPAEVQAQTPTAGGTQFRRTPPNPFRITIDGVPEGAFLRFEVMSEQMQVIEYQDGADPTTRKRPGRVGVPDLVLHKNITETAPDVYNWWTACENGQIERREIVVQLVDGRGAPQRRWTYVNAWPSKWEVTVAENGTPSEAFTFSAEAVQFD